MTEVLTCLTSAKSMMTEVQVMDAETTVAMNDLMSAVITVHNSSKGMVNLTDTMKQELISGFKTLKLAVCKAAYKYYSSHEFEDTPEVIPLMREVVEVYAENGGCI